MFVVCEVVLENCLHVDKNVRVVFRANLRLDGTLANCHMKSVFNKLICINILLKVRTRIHFNESRKLIMHQEISNEALALHDKINKEITRKLMALKFATSVFEQAKKEKNGLNHWAALSNYKHQQEIYTNQIKELVYKYKYLFESLTKTSQDRKVTFEKIYNFLDGNQIKKEKSALMFFVELEVNDADFTHKRRIDKNFYEKNEANTRLIEEKIKHKFETFHKNNRSNYLLSKALKELEDFKAECLSYDTNDLKELINSDELSEGEISIVRIILKQRYDAEVKTKENHKNIK